MPQGAATRFVADATGVTTITALAEPCCAPKAIEQRTEIGDGSLRVVASASGMTAVLTGSPKPVE